MWQRSAGAAHVDAITRVYAKIIFHNRWGRALDELIRYMRYNILYPANTTGRDEASEATTLGSLRPSEASAHPVPCQRPTVY
jgi:hypothetical protein